MHKCANGGHCIERFDMTWQRAILKFQKNKTAATKVFQPISRELN